MQSFKIDISEVGGITPGLIFKISDTYNNKDAKVFFFELYFKSEGVFTKGGKGISFFVSGFHNHPEYELGSFIACWITSIDDEAEIVIQSKDNKENFLFRSIVVGTSETGPDAIGFYASFLPKEVDGERVMIVEGSIKFAIAYKLGID